MEMDSGNNLQQLGEIVPEYGSVGAALLLLCLVSAALFYLLWTEIAAPTHGGDGMLNDGELGITAELLRARMEQCMQRVELVSDFIIRMLGDAACSFPHRLYASAKGLI